MIPPKFLIIGGTEKSGTTSVYQYLAAHPDVAASRRKETDYFRSAGEHSLEDYMALFSGGGSEDTTYMEASPGYLAQSAIAAPAMNRLVPQAKLLFILRDPIARLLSGFDFHKSRFHIPDSMSFDEYIELCMRFERGDVAQEKTGLKLWHLQVPEAGRYGAHLKDYFDRYPAAQIRVTSIEQLQANPLGYMQGICQWAEIDGGFYTGFEFERANVTFRPRNRVLQRAGLFVNNALEPLFNRRPGLKRSLLSVYKRVNGAKVQRPAMSSATRERLETYYLEDFKLLNTLTGDGGEMVQRWAQGYRVK